MLRQCPNCGAPLRNGYCQYCGTHKNEFDLRPPVNNIRYDPNKIAVIQEEMHTELSRDERLNEHFASEVMEKIRMKMASDLIKKALEQTQFEVEENPFTGTLTVRARLFIFRVDEDERWKVYG